MSIGAPATPAVPLARAREIARADWLITVVSVALTLSAWQLAGWLGELPDYILAPLDIGGALFREAGTLASASLASMRLVVVGFTIGAALGAIVGLLAGVLGWVEDLVDPLVSSTNPLPKIALFPIIAVWMGFTDQARILLIAIGCFYPAFVNALSSTRGINERLLWVAGNAGAGRLRTFWSVVVPATLPRVVVGLRISLALSFIVVFAVEALASNDGLGYEIFFGYQGQDYDLMYAAIGCFAILGFAADRLLLLVGRRLTPGQNIDVLNRG